MNKAIILFCLSIITLQAQGQNADSLQYRNSADKIIASDGKLNIGGYAEVHYNQPFGGDKRGNGSLDVHRMVMMMGYKFDHRTQFVTEIEYEHVSEVYIEQAFLQYKLNSFVNLRGGLMLIPMGIVNETHEPATFNGVERPLVDNKLAPTTWREIGIGAQGNILPASLRYQVYLVNGFNGYDGAAKLNGNNAFRSGRQKGAESYLSSPNFTAKVEYYGIRGLSVGASGYFGKTQSKLYNGIDKNNAAALAKADSSVVGISMLGLDGRYSYKGLELRGQFYYTTISNTDQYNRFTKSGTKLNDLGSAMTGYYLEAGYDLLRFAKNTTYGLVPFIRVENSNTHSKVAEGITKNQAYNIKVITSGLTFKLAKGAVVKADVQFSKPEAADSYTKVFNAGFGVMF